MYHTPQSGKGDKPRPMKVTLDEYRDNWESIFGKKDENQPAEETDKVVEHPDS